MWLFSISPGRRLRAEFQRARDDGLGQELPAGGSRRAERSGAAGVLLCCLSVFVECLLSSIVFWYFIEFVICVLKTKTKRVPLLKGKLN